MEKRLVMSRFYSYQAPIVTINNWNEWTETSYFTWDADIMELAF